jgi:hypothetical protein
MSLVEKKVRVIRWRLEWLNFMRRLVRVLLIVLVLATLYVTVGKFVRLPWTLDVLAPWLAAATIPLALLWAVLTRTTVREAAILTDRQMALRERLSSTLMLGSPQTAMEQALAADAEVHARPLLAHRVFPMPVWRDLYYLPIPVLVMIVVGLFVPQFNLGAAKRAEADKPLPTPAQQELAKRLEMFQRELEKNAKTAAPIQMRELSSEMQELLKRLQSREMTHTDVLKDLSSMSDRLAERKAEIEKKAAAAQDLNRLRSADLTKPMADALSKGNFDKAKAELDKLAEQLNKDALSKEQRQKLAAELKGMSDALKDNSALSGALAQAAKNLDAGDVNSALKDLELSAAEMQDLADTLKQMADLDQLAKALKELGPGHT